VIFIEVDEQYGDLVSRDLLQEAAQETLQTAQLEKQVSLAIKISGENEIQELNSAYRGIDQATDVLSFEADFFDPDLESRYLGDVVVSYPQAALQAQKRGHSTQAELQLLVIHGVLHLLGYDHQSVLDKESMWLVQNQVLQALGLDIPIEDEE
jgi:probable rRNA maturation factor